MSSLSRAQDWSFSLCPPSCNWHLASINASWQSSPGCGVWHKNGNGCSLKNASITSRSHRASSVLERIASKLESPVPKLVASITLALCLQLVYVFPMILGVNHSENMTLQPLNEGHLFASSLTLCFWVLLFFCTLKTGTGRHGWFGCKYPAIPNRATAAMKLENLEASVKHKFAPAPTPMQNILWRSMSISCFTLRSTQRTTATWSVLESAFPLSPGSTTTARASAPANATGPCSALVAVVLFPSSTKIHNGIRALLRRS